MWEASSGALLPRVAETASVCEGEPSYGTAAAVRAIASAPGITGGTGLGTPGAGRRLGGVARYLSPPGSGFRPAPPPAPVRPPPPRGPRPCLRPSAAAA